MGTRGGGGANSGISGAVVRKCRGSITYMSSLQMQKVLRLGIHNQNNDFITLQ